MGGSREDGWYFGEKNARLVMPSEPMTMTMVIKDSRGNGFGKGGEV